MFEGANPAVWYYRCSFFGTIVQWLDATGGRPAANGHTDGNVPEGWEVWEVEAKAWPPNRR